MEFHTFSDEDLKRRGLVRCELDGRVRPEWAMTNDQLRDYFDYEWGAPATSETEFFERLCLEGLQAGLSWNLILGKRRALRMAFHNFEVDAVAAMTQEDVERLAAHPSLVRNPSKLRALVSNAQAAQRLRDQGGLVELICSFAPPKRQDPLRSVEDIPATTEESAALAKALKQAGFKFVGPTTCYALMQATGLIDDRVEGSSPLLPKVD